MKRLTAPQQQQMAAQQVVTVRPASGGRTLSQAVVQWAAQQPWAGQPGAAQQEAAQPISSMGMGRREDYARKDG